MPTHRTGNNAYAIQTIAPGSSGAAANVAGAIYTAGFRGPQPPSGVPPTAGAIILSVPEVVSGAISGTGSTSQLAQTLAAAGLERFIGASSASQLAQVHTAAGVERFSGTAAVAAGVQEHTAAGSERFLASGLPVQPAQTHAASGAERFIGAMAAAQPVQAHDAAGLARFAGQVATAQPVQTLAAAGSERFLAASATAQATQEHIASGVVQAAAISGTVSTNQAEQVHAASGTVPTTASVMVGGLRMRRRPPMPQRVIGLAMADQHDQTLRATAKLISIGALRLSQPIQPAVAQGRTRPSWQMDDDDLLALLMAA